MRVPSASACVVSLISTPEYGAPLTVLPITAPWTPIIFTCAAIFSMRICCCAVSSCAAAIPVATSAAAAIPIACLIMSTSSPSSVARGAAHQAKRTRPPVGSDNHVCLDLLWPDGDPHYHAGVDRFVVERHKLFRNGGRAARRRRLGSRVHQDQRQSGRRRECRRPTRPRPHLTLRVNRHPSTG